MTSPDVPARTAAARTARTAAAVAHLAAVGTVGPILFTVLITLFAVGVALVPAFGVGLIVLVAAVYLLFAMGWLETERVNGLYGLGVSGLSPRRNERGGFGGWVRMLWQQLVDGPTWRGVAHAALSTLLGTIALAFLTLFGTSIVLLFAPLTRAETVRILGTSAVVPTAWATAAGILGLLTSLAAVVGLALLQGVLARAVVVPSREAQLTEQVRTSDVQRAGAVRASEVERTRIERDLHDGVQPRLVSVGMTLGLAQQKIDTDPDAARDLIAEAHTSTKAAITELRQLARGIHASVLDDRGLDAALSALAARSHVPVHLDVRIDSRCSRTAEAAVYFVVAESLTNAAKHSRASECRVVVRSREDGTLWARVEDNGVGGARVLAGGGLDGITNRIVAAGGTARLDSPAGGPTALEVSVPCAS